MTAAQDSYAGWSYYTYDADGSRTRRKSNNQETWQVYGLGGELLAEYVANAAAASPQKEYGYRNGQLLVTAAGTVVSSGLVGHWKLDENSGTTAADSSGTGNTGTLTSGAGWNTGQSGSAVSLDGVNDYVQVGSQSSLVMTSAVSLGAWVYPTGAGSEPTYGGTIVVKEGEYIIARFPNGKIEWGFANSNPGWTFIDTGYVAPLNQWTHIAVTYSNGTIKTYANGNLVHTYNGSGSIGDAITGQNDFRIGGRQITSQHFQGRIDDVRVYNRALTVGEISSIVSVVNWLVTDHLGTPRMIVDQTGTLANLKRHDYLPFGEELFAGAGGRTTGTGYSGGDGVRQQFTSQERDVETGLDFMQARYYSSMMGRFTSPDSVAGRSVNPQTFNLYSYVLNNPLRYVDPTGHTEQDPDRPHPNQPCSQEKPCDPDSDDRVVTFVDHKKTDKILDAASPFNIPTFLCPTGICPQGRTIRDDVNFLRGMVRNIGRVGNAVVQNTDAVELNVNVFWVIDGTASLTADGDVFLTFTPPQAGVVEVIVDVARNAITHPVPVSASFYTTHIFYNGAPDNQETRRAFFGGSSLGAGVAVPVFRGVGPFVGLTYSPTEKLFASQRGIGTAPQVNAGYSLSTNNPVFSAPKLAWKK